MGRRFGVLFLLLNFCASNGEGTAYHRFGTCSIDDVTIDFDQVHKNLRRFEAHASARLSSSKLKNNVVVGTITIFFGEADEDISSDASSSSSTSGSSSIKGARTFYLETSDKKLLIFESTSRAEGEENREVDWGKTGLGLVDGHSMMQRQSDSVKSLSFVDMDSFFSSMPTCVTSAPGSSELDRRHPCSIFRESFTKQISGETLGARARRLFELQTDLRAKLSCLSRLGDAHKMLFAENMSSTTKSASDDDLQIPAFLDDENLEREIGSATDATTARNYVSKIRSINSAISGLTRNAEDALRDLEDQSEALDEFAKLAQVVQRHTTEIYGLCWHSEQRLFHYLFSGLGNVDSDNPTSESDYSFLCFTMPASDPSIKPADPNVFDWRSLESIGGDLEAKMVFLHIHSRFQFCDMCLYTLENIVMQLMDSVPFSPGWKFGGILGSYRESYEKSTDTRLVSDELMKFPSRLSDYEEYKPRLFMARYPGAE